MTKGQIVSWFQEVATMLQTVSNLEENVSKIKGNADLATAAGDANQLMALNTNLKQLQDLLVKMTPIILERTKTHDLEGARLLMTDLQINIERSEQQFLTWRKAVTAFEYANKVGEIAETEDKGTTRAQWEEYVTKTHEAYDAALNFVSESIPSSVRLLHV